MLKNLTRQEQINYILENGANLGPKKCSENLGISRYAAQNLFCDYKIKFNNGIKLEDFTRLDTKELIYLLGFFWADGTISKAGKLAFFNVEEDMREVLPTFLKVCDWRTCHFKPKAANRKDVLVVFKSSVRVAKFLKENGYKEDALKFIRMIPENLLPYWFRGLIDGDGHICKITKKNGFRVQISSSFEENWEYMEWICNKLKLPYNIFRKHWFNKERNKTEGHSEFRISGIHRTLKFLDWIYKDREDDKIGLTRKYNAYLDMKKYKPDYNINGFRGLFPAKAKYGVRINLKKKKYFLGYFPTKEEAAEAYDKKAVEFFGLKATTNFPIENYLVESPQKDDLHEPSTLFVSP